VAFAFAPVLILAGNVQLPNLVLPPQAAADRKAVVDAFTSSYNAYKKFAFRHDSLEPEAESFVDDFYGWGATIFDAMGTMIIMNLMDLYDEAVKFAATVNFDVNNNPTETVSVFETTIRYIGGSLSAYELAGRRPQDRVLVEKAQQIANHLSLAWVGENKIPYGELNYTINEPVIQAANIAEAGTLSLEWGLLSQLTGNKTYGDLTLGSVMKIIAAPDQFPGLPAQGIDPVSGQPVGSYITWGGGSDSYFEYLIKYARMFPNAPSELATTWLTAVDSSIRELVRTSTVGGHTYVADFDGENIRHVGSHLECFNAGNWILGGKLLNNETIVNYGLAINEGCWNTYASTATGIGPETFAYISSDGNFTGGDPITSEQIAFNEKHGFYITGSDYILRPEVLESNFYAFRTTGEEKYLDRARSALNSFNKFLAVHGAYSGINDVNNAKGGGGIIDETESFFFAEVLKYLYLTFDDPNHISLDHYVFNTECHPYPVGPSQINVGTPTTDNGLQEPFVFIDAPVPQISPNAKLPKQIATLLHINAVPFSPSEE